MQPFHFFKAGRHTSANGKEIHFSDDDLRQIAAGYDAKHHEAPIVVGHPKTDAAPAYGWVAGVTHKADGLYATAENVNADFAELVKGGSFKKVSASFYTPESKGNPTPGRYHLRHIGFLGATPPALKGLQPIEFASGDGIVTLEFEEAATMGQHDSADFAEKLRRLDALDAREAAFAEKMAKVRATEDAAFVSTIVAAGCLPKALEAATVAIFAELDDDVIDFADPASDEDVKTTARDLLKSVLSKWPKPVMEGELARDAIDDESHVFSGPNGYEIEPKAMRLRQEALDYAHKEGVSFEEAVKSIKAGKYPKEKAK